GEGAPMLAFAAGKNGELQTLSDGLPDETLLAADSASFGSAERQFRARFVPNAAGVIEAVQVRAGTTAERKLPRIAPLPSSLKPSADADPAASARIGGVFRL